MNSFDEEERGGELIEKDMREGEKESEKSQPFKSFSQLNQQSE